MKKPKAWYLSVLRHHAKSVGVDLHMYRNVISESELNGLSIHNILKTAMLLTDDKVELVNLVQQKIDVDSSSVRVAINHLRNKG